MKATTLLVPIGLFVALSFGPLYGDNKGKDDATATAAAATTDAKTAAAPAADAARTEEGRTDAGRTDAASAGSASRPAETAENRAEQHDGGSPPPREEHDGGNPPPHDMAQGTAQTPHDGDRHDERSHDNSSKQEDDAQEQAAQLQQQAQEMAESAIANAPESPSVAGTESVSGNSSPCNTNNAPLQKDPRGHHTMQGMARSMQDMGPDPTDRAHHSMGGLF
jgi:hypothetical protein